jgi:hypothetical protein
MLTETQKEKLHSIWLDYIQNNRQWFEETNQQNDDELDRKRLEVIPEVLDWLDKFFTDEIPLEEFKTGVDGLNKRNPLWGFSAINGQMFFNMLTKTSINNNKLDELSELLKDLLQVPDSIDEAQRKIKRLESFVIEISRDISDRRRAPKVGSIPYFLSYFWQIQNPNIYPIYYTSMIEGFRQNEIWTPSGDVSTDYRDFYFLNFEIKEYLSNETGREISLWDIEHMLWYNIKKEPTINQEEEIDVIETPTRVLPKSYIPPIISVLPKLAKNDPEVALICAQSNRSVEKEFEERCAILFSILGFETQIYGQGRGRVPDGVALCDEYRYAIIFDAKVRQGSYTMGTDERAIREYIYAQSTALRRRGVMNIYFMIISSSFSGEHDDAIRGIKIDTPVNEVILAEVNALLAMVENKLRDPMINLGPESLQRLFANSGVLSESDVRNYLEN